jgi:hypothetical protein
MSYIWTALIAFVSGLLVMAIFKARAITFLKDEIGRLKDRL